MNPRNTCLTLMTMVACASSVSFGATISGTVKGPEGAALKGVFVEAQNDKTNTTFMVLSDGQGYYRIEKLPAGDYQLSTKFTGYESGPLEGVKLAAGLPPLYKARTNWVTAAAHWVGRDCSSRWGPSISMSWARGR
jgi:hypothetical protein